MAGLCSRAPLDDPMNLCDKPASHVLTIRSVTRKTFRVDVCDEHWAEGNQSAAKLRTESKERRG